MKVVKHPTAFAAVSELRTKMDQILAQLRETPVILEKHGRPVAVFVEPARFKAMQEGLESAVELLVAFEGETGRRKGRAALQELEKRLHHIRRASPPPRPGRG